MYLERDLYRISKKAQEQGPGQGGLQMISVLMLEDQKLLTEGRCWGLRKGFPGRTKHVPRHRGIKQHPYPPPGSPSCPTWRGRGGSRPSLLCALLALYWRLKPLLLSAVEMSMMWAPWSCRWEVTGQTPDPSCAVPSRAVQPTVNLVEQTSLFAED